MQLEHLVEQVAASLGYELIDFELSPRGRLIRVFIDTPAGVTINDCERLSNQLQRVFEVENVDYDRLEVSSPGLDRVLKKPAHFQRFLGSRAQLRLKEAPAGARRHFVGQIAAADETSVTLALDDGQQVRFELAEIERARLVPQFD